jgi:hypothetical protein
MSHSTQRAHTHLCLSERRITPYQSSGTGWLTVLRAQESVSSACAPVAALVAALVATLTACKLLGTCFISSMLVMRCRPLCLSSAACIRTWASKTFCAGLGKLEDEREAVRGRADSFCDVLDPGVRCWPSSDFL